MNCYRFNEIASDYIEGTLTISETQQADAHLQSCAECRSLADDLRDYARSLKTLDSFECSANFDDRLKARLMETGRKKSPSRSAFLYSFMRPLSAAAAVILVVSALYISYTAYYPNLSPLSGESEAAAIPPGQHLSAPQGYAPAGETRLASQPQLPDSSQDNRPNFDDEIRLVNDK